MVNTGLVKRMRASGADFHALLAGDALLREKLDLLAKRIRLRVVAPLAIQVAALEEDAVAYSRSIINGKTLDIKYPAFLPPNSEVSIFILKILSGSLGSFN